MRHGPGRAPSGRSVAAVTGRQAQERRDVGETDSAFASDSRVSSGGVRCPRSSMEMYETERPALAARASFESLRRSRSLLRFTANLSARPGIDATPASCPPGELRD